MNNKNYIFIKEGPGKLVKIFHKDILFIESDKDYCKIVASDKMHYVNVSMGAIESDLPADIFHRCHRCFLVNVDMITTIKSYSIFIDNNIIPISEGKKYALLQKMNYLPTTPERKNDNNPHK